MNCAEFEVLLADYIDGTLGPSGVLTVEQHASLCASCRELLNDASGAVRFIKMTSDVIPPPELITRLAYQAPAGRIRLPDETQGILSRLSSWLQPVLQPRLAMGMAMTILSFAMLERCTGVRVQRIEAADLNPVRIWGGVEDKTLRLKDRAVKYYENLRWVYEIETRLKSLENQQQALENQGNGPTERKGEHTRGAVAPDQRRNQK